MSKSTIREIDAMGRGAYGGSEAMRLINFQRMRGPDKRPISSKTIHRWRSGYDYVVSGDVHHSEPLWQADYANDDEQILEVSFRDLIELRFVKTFRDLGLGLPTIRECFARAVEEVHEARPFSSRKFQTDGKSIFLEITRGVKEVELLDLRRRQTVFRAIVAPSLHDLDFDAEEVARWFPLGRNRNAIVIDPARAFGRPLARESGVPTQVLAAAVEIEGSIAAVARLYDVAPNAVKDAIEFEQLLAA